MNALHASHCDRRLLDDQALAAASATHTRAHAERQRQRRLRRYVRTASPNRTGPGKSASSSATTSRDRRSCRRLVAPRHLAEDERRRAHEQPASRSCVSIRSSRYGRSPTSSRNSTYPSGGSNAYGVPSDAISWVSVPPSEHPARLAWRDDLDLRVRNLAGWFGAAETTRERVAIVAILAPAKRPSSIGP